MTRLVAYIRFLSKFLTENSDQFLPRSLTTRRIPEKITILFHEPSDDERRRLPKPVSLISSAIASSGSEVSYETLFSHLHRLTATEDHRLHMWLIITQRGGS